MIVKAWKLFTFSDSWPWALVAGIPTILAGLAYNYNYFTTTEGIPAAGQIALLSTLAAFWGVTALRYVLRNKFIKSIVGYSADGTAVILSDASKAKVSTPTVLLDIVTTQMRDTLSFWNKWAVKNGKSQQTVAIFNGCTLSIEDKPIQTIGWSQKLAGLEIGGTISVVWTTSSLQDIVPILRWETARHCLDAMGLDTTEAEQNAVMQAANFA